MESNKLFVPILTKSEKDTTAYASQIANMVSKLNEVGIHTTIRICQITRTPKHILNWIKKYDQTQNCLGLICCFEDDTVVKILQHRFLKPIFICHDFTPHNCNYVVSSVIRCCSLLSTTIREKLETKRDQEEASFIIQDIKNKYNDINLNHASLDSCMEDTKTMFLGYGEKYTFVKNGKIRDIFQSTDNPNELLLVASDRLSSFDMILTSIPSKGKILNKISEWWFQNTAELVPNHYLETKQDRIMVVKKSEVIPIEFVMRAYLTGSTDTSIWKNYEKGIRQYCGHELPEGLAWNQRLEKNLLTPTTKGEKDFLISGKEIVNQQILTDEEWELCSTYAHCLFNYGQKIAKKRGLILVDTKYEFGKDPETGKIRLIDELHTPDSSRYWIASSYKERFVKGEAPDMIDKEFIRRWVREKYPDPYKASAIEISDEMRLKTANRYAQLYEIITGNCL